MPNDNCNIRIRLNEITLKLSEKNNKFKKNIY